MPAEALAILSRNPVFIDGATESPVLLEGQSPAIHTLVKFWALAVIVFLAGHAWFYKLRRSFADIV